jgi:hypothetical protein
MSRCGPTTTSGSSPGGFERLQRAGDTLLEDPEKNREGKLEHSARLCLYKHYLSPNFFRN